MDPAKPASNSKADYLLHILQTIGAPLMSAITDVTPADQDNPQNEATIMATLLGKTVEASIDLGQIMQIDPAQAQDDTLRVALAGLAGPLVAGEYTNRKRVPESPEIKKITTALQAVLTFSDNFTPTPETVERLKNLEANGQAADSYQIQIQYMQAFIPVVEAIAQFPFGQAEAKLIMDVSDRIVKKSVELREALLPNENDEGVQKLVELGFVKALGQLYSACHMAETEKFTNTDQDAQTAISIDPVWKAFDMRVAMLEALAAKMVPAGATAQAGGSSGGGPAVAATATAAPVTPPATPPPPAEATPAAPPVQPPPAQTQPPVQPPAQPVAPPPAETPPPAAPPTQPPTTPPTDQGGASAGGNPMSMFAKKPEGGQPAASPPPAAPPPAAPPPQTAETPPAAPPVQPPPAQTQPPAQPPVQPPAEAPAQPVAPPPAEAPPAQTAQPETPPPVAPQDGTQEGEGEQGDQGQGGSPMSFFKKE